MKRLILKIRTKLRSPRGETLGEVLVALLVAALAITMLAGAIGVSTRLVINSKEKMTEYYNKNSAISDGIGTSDEGSVSFGTTKLIDNNIEVSVKFYTNDTFEANSVVAYHN